MLYVLHTLGLAMFAAPTVRAGAHELLELDRAANTIATTVSAIASGKNKMAGCRRMMEVAEPDEGHEGAMPQLLDPGHLFIPVQPGKYGVASRKLRV
jgi:hypothetical protein